VIFTRIAWIAGLVLLAALCWLAIRGLTSAALFLLTGLVLLLLIGGGNYLNNRSSPSAGPRRPPDSRPPGDGE